MDVLQNDYGLAIRKNLDNVEEMAKAVKASLLHVASQWSSEEVQAVGPKELRESEIKKEITETTQEEVSRQC